MSQSSDVERGSEEHRRLLALARAEYEDGSDDNLDIDEDAAVSKGEGGCWIAAAVDRSCGNDSRGLSDSAMGNARNNKKPRTGRGFLRYSFNASMR